MQVIQHTIQNLHEQPGHIGTGGFCPSVRQRLTRMGVGASLFSLSIANEIFKAYESDLDMT